MTTEQRRRHAVSLHWFWEVGLIRMLKSYRARAGGTARHKKKSSCHCGMWQEEAVQGFMAAKR